ncbi:MAG: Crp/Fnr family transcriptional regulator [Magnetococcales bacterium]|nr:Crp/Fnr family transcriptional regulator [Magnetococcales bacterium]
MFADLSSEQLDNLGKSSRDIRLTSGQALFHQGDAAAQFFVLRTGRIKLFRLSEEGHEKVIEIITPGLTFGEAVMFMEQKRYPVNAEAIGDCRLIGFDNRVYMEILQQSPETCFILLASMSRWLHRQVMEIDRLTLQSAMLRLCGYLLQLAPATGKSKPVVVQLPVPKRVIASRLSVQPETFSRLLQSLVKDGIIQVFEQEVHILDMDRLREMTSLSEG